MIIDDHRNHRWLYYPIFIGSSQNPYESHLTKAVDQLGEVVRCPNPDCSCALTVDGGRQRWQCCEWPAWCTKCRQPYHYKVECVDVEAEKLVILRVFSDYANVVRNTVGMLLI